jgi:beta-phosphoglucomutase
LLQDLNQKITTDSILFFDLDGTLVNTDFANYLAYKQAIQSITQLNPEILYDPNQRFNRSVLKSTMLNLNDVDYERIIQEKERFYKNYLSETTLNEVIVNELFKYSKTNKTILVTNCREDRALMTLNYYGLADKFNNIFCRNAIDGENRINKYEKAILYLNILPKSVIVFENEKREIDDAMRAGIPNENILNL